MAASMELNDKLQKISALMGLLRSDLLELSEAKDASRRAPVVDHVRWIADQLDAAGAGLSDKVGKGASDVELRSRRADARKSPPGSAGASVAGGSKTGKRGAAAAARPGTTASKSGRARATAAERSARRSAPHPEAALGSRRHRRPEPGDARMAMPTIPQDAKRPDDAPADVLRSRDDAPTTPDPVASGPPKENPSR
ncbi:MAG: hypothetical protein P0Y66_07280 [Candidatus Kaistia colombiensis]|nr:MAG: hypothetical protein P0Y66_07280 [Kaistia sp.]